nr:band-7 C-terminal domain-containing protein [bacterium]
NEAEGRAQEIERVAQATAKGIREIAAAIAAPGGSQAVNLRIAEQYLGEFGKLATKSNTMIIPANLTDVAGTVATVARIFSETNKGMNEPPKPA